MHDYSIEMDIPETDVFGTVVEIGIRHSQQGSVFVSKPSSEINVSHLEQEVWFWYS